MPRVFISYASPDKDVAYRIAGFLEGEGIACWIAPRDVPPGKEYGAAIIEGIEGSGALILVLSENSNESHFVRREVERAVSKAKPVLPLRIREVAPSGALEFFISSAQWVDASRPPLEQHLAQLAAAIRAVAGEAPAAAGPLPPSPPPSRRRLRLGLATLLLLAVAGLGLWFWSPWLAAWQRDPAAFLAGSWCQPLSGEAIARTDYQRQGKGQVTGEMHFSHSTEVYFFRAAVAAEGGELVFTWQEPEDLAANGHSRFRVEGDDALRLVFANGPVADAPAMTRCPSTAGN